MRTHSGLAAGPAEWLLVFLEVERAELASPRRSERPERTGRPERTERHERTERAAPLLSRRGRPEESPFGRLNARSA